MHIIKYTICVRACLCARAWRGWTYICLVHKQALMKETNLFYEIIASSLQSGGNFHGELLIYQLCDLLCYLISSCRAWLELFTGRENHNKSFWIKRSNPAVSLMNLPKLSIWEWSPFDLFHPFHFFLSFFVRRARIIKALCRYSINLSRSDDPRRKPDLIPHTIKWNKRAKPCRRDARVQALYCTSARVVLLALSSSVILRYQTEIHGAETNSLFMGSDRDQHEYVQKVTSAIQIYRVITKAKSKVKRDNPAVASYPRESAKHLPFLGSTWATEEITGLWCLPEHIVAANRHLCRLLFPFMFAPDLIQHFVPMEICTFTSIFSKVSLLMQTDLLHSHRGRYWCIQHLKCQTDC